MLVSSINPFLSSLSRQSLSGRLIRSFSSVPNLWIDKKSNVLGQYISQSGNGYYRYDQSCDVLRSTLSKKNKLGMTFEEAVIELKPSATVINGTLKSSAPIIDSIKAEIPLIVCSSEVADAHFEGIKWHLKQSGKSTLIGPFSRGIFRPKQFRLGELLPSEMGKIAVAARGRMVYASMQVLINIKLGQSIVLDIGASEFNGINLVQACQYFIRDTATEGILLSGYLGHRAEDELLHWLAQERRTDKPIVVFLHHPASIPFTDETKELMKQCSEHEVRFTFHSLLTSSNTAIANFFSNI